MYLAIASGVNRTASRELVIGTSSIFPAFSRGVLLAGHRSARSNRLECGLQNGTLAIAIAVLLFGGGLATVRAATYSLTMFVTALIYVAVLRRTQGTEARFTA